MQNLKDEYLEMLKIMRPAMSVEEDEWCEKFILPIVEIHGGFEDSFGNFMCEIGDNPDKLFLAHTDTVHQMGGQQKLLIDDQYSVVSSTANCLGADDTTGVFILLQLLKSSNPPNGVYIFNREEEIGCNGSEHCANTLCLDNITQAISFDRKGYNDIVTTQLGVRTASTQYALQYESLGMRSAIGSVTDSASFRFKVNECVNLSVGYFNQHTTNEYQDIDFMLELIDKLLEFDWDNLQVFKEPCEEIDWGYANYGYNHSNGYRSSVTYPPLKPKKTHKKIKVKTKAPVYQHTASKLEIFIRNRPRATNDFLEHMGFGLADIHEYLDDQNSKDFKL